MNEFSRKLTGTRSFLARKTSCKFLSELFSKNLAAGSWPEGLSVTLTAPKIGTKRALPRWAYADELTQMSLRQKDQENGDSK